MAARIDAKLTSVTVRIVLVDDHGVVREGLSMLLSSNPGFDVLAEAADVEGARRAVRAHQPDVPGARSQHAGRLQPRGHPRLREEFPATSVVILTMQAEPELAREAMREGASGYVLKDGAHAQLVEAVSAAAAGRIYLDPLLGARLAAEPPPSGPPDGLTRREVEVLQLLAAGYTNAEVAKQLFMSVRMAETHRAQIQRKIACSSRAEVTRYALERGLIEREHIVRISTYSEWQSGSRLPRSAPRVQERSYCRPSRFSCPSAARRTPATAEGSVRLAGSSSPSPTVGARRTASV